MNEPIPPDVCFVLQRASGEFFGDDRHGPDEPLWFKDHNEAFVVHFRDLRNAERCGRQHFCRIRVMVDGRLVP
jgi:hypothetical protein